VLTYTIVSRAYVPHARVLARSYAQFHDEPLWALLIDDVAEEVDGTGEPFEVLRLSDLELDQREIHRMAMLFGGRLIAAIKPWVFQHFLQRGASSVFYIDSDFTVYDSLADLGQAATEHGVLVVPHVLNPIPRDGCKPDETMVLSVGTFNAGMFGVGPNHGGFLEFLMERLRRECRTDIEAMRVNEQRWLDFVPALFPHLVVRDAGVDVAPWNVHERHLSKVGGRYMAGNTPLRAFHFSGFDPRLPSVLSARDYWRRPRVQVGDEPALRELIDRYGRDLMEAGFDGSHRIPFAFDALPDGTTIPASLRALYEATLFESERDQTVSEPPDPFDRGETVAFGNWAEAAYADVGLDLPVSLQAQAGAKQSIAIDGSMPVAEAGRRGPAGLLQADPARKGFVGTCQKLLLERGHYQLSIDVSYDEHTGEVPSGLIVDLSIDRMVIACSEIPLDRPRPFIFEVDVSAELEPLALSAGAELRFVTYGGVEAIVNSVLVRRVGDESSEAAPVDWLREMAAASASSRVGNEIHHAPAQRGLIAMGPHWSLEAGSYRGVLTARLTTPPIDQEAFVLFVEALVHGHGVMLDTFRAVDLVEQRVEVAFTVSAEPGDRADVEIRLRGESDAGLVVQSIFVAAQDQSASDPAPPITDWLPALWVNEPSFRSGFAICSGAGAAGVIAMGPHWRLRRGAYVATAHLAVDDRSGSRRGHPVGSIEVLVDGSTIARQVVESKGRSETKGMQRTGGTRPYDLPFQVNGIDRDSDIEVRFVTAGIATLTISGLELRAVGSAVRPT
jgi:hypothetical protein